MKLKTVLGASRRNCGKEPDAAHASLHWARFGQEEQGVSGHVAVHDFHQAMRRSRQNSNPCRLSYVSLEGRQARRLD